MATIFFEFGEPLYNYSLIYVGGLTYKVVVYTRSYNIHKSYLIHIGSAIVVVAIVSKPQLRSSLYCTCANPPCVCILNFDPADMVHIRIAIVLKITKCNKLTCYIILLYISHREYFGTFTSGGGGVSRQKSMI